MGEKCRTQGRQRCCAILTDSATHWLAIRSYMRKVCSLVLLTGASQSVLKCQLESERCGPPRIVCSLRYKFMRNCGQYAEPGLAKAAVLHWSMLCPTDLQAAVTWMMCLLA